MHIKYEAAGDPTTSVCIFAVPLGAEPAATPAARSRAASNQRAKEAEEQVAQEVDKAADMARQANAGGVCFPS